jgi:hypothetical protein
LDNCIYRTFRGNFARFDKDGTAWKCMDFANKGKWKFFAWVEKKFLKMSGEMCDIVYGERTKLPVCVKHWFDTFFYKSKGDSIAVKKVAKTVGNKDFLVRLWTVAGATCVLSVVALITFYLLNRCRQSQRVVEGSDV